MKTMKNILLAMLVALTFSACSKDSPVDPVAPVNPPAPADRWEDVLTCNIDQVFPEDETGPAIVRFNLVISGQERYYVPQFPIVHIKSQGKQLYLSGDNYVPSLERRCDWKNGDGVDAQALARYLNVSVLPQIGIFDFTLEVPAPNPTANKSYRTKLLRLKIDQNESGVWSAEFLPIQN